MRNRFDITYSDLIEAHKSKSSQLDKAYEELIIPLKDSWKELDIIIDFVRRWDSRVPIGKNKGKIKETVLTLKKEFDILKNYNIENLEFNLENIKLIKKIFDELSETALKSTGTTKLMHGINPNLFVMWDKGICMRYGCYPNSEGYINFMILMQEIILKILKHRDKKAISKETNRTLPKLIDEYNWMNFSTSKSIKKVSQK